MTPRIPFALRGYFPAFVAILWTAAACAAPSITLTPQNATAIYKPGEKIVWQVTVNDDPEASIKEATYELRKGGADVIGSGTLNFSAGASTIETSLDGPGTILAEVTAHIPGQKDIQTLAGAAVAPEQIKVSSPCPEDFDAFWKGKLDELAAVPENPVLEKVDGDRANVDYWKITMDNIRGTHIQGQIARPAGDKTGDKKLPAMLIVQWAGVYGLPKSNVTERAAEGWIALNIMAHDLPFDQPKAFYDEQGKNALKNYTAIGNDDREKSYFLRMFLACYRAVDYLSQRPDWDGKTLVVTGVSQGGLQSFVAAGLNPKVTAMIVGVPAGCDNTGALAGRKPGWPYWIASAGGNDIKKVTETSRYFDAVNFATRVKCPALVGLGLIDVTAPPTGIFAAINQLHGPQEMVVMPKADHQGHNNSHAAFNARAGVWRAALLKGEPVPPASAGK